MPEQHFPVEALWVISNKHTPSQRENKARENQSSIIEQTIPQPDNNKAIIRLTDKDECLTGMNNT